MMRIQRFITSAAIVLAFPMGIGAARAQTTTPGQQSQIAPAEPLGDSLNRNNGVITPPANVDRSMAVQPPPKSGEQTTPVIPPPGSPGGDQTVKPK